MGLVLSHHHHDHDHDYHDQHHDHHHHLVVFQLHNTEELMRQALRSEFVAIARIPAGGKINVRLLHRDAAVMAAAKNVAHDLCMDALRREIRARMLQKDMRKLEGYGTRAWYCSCVRDVYRRGGGGEGDQLRAQVGSMVGLEGDLVSDTLHFPLLPRFGMRCERDLAAMRGRDAQEGPAAVSMSQCTSCL